MPQQDTPSTIGKRVEKARRELSARLVQAVSQGRFADLLNAKLPKAYRIKQGQVSLWENDRQRPELEHFEAMEKVTGRSRIWLAWGIESEAESTILMDPASDHLLTSDEIENAKSAIGRGQSVLGRQRDGGKKRGGKG